MSLFLRTIDNLDKLEKEFRAGDEMHVEWVNANNACCLERID